MEQLPSPPFGFTKTTVLGLNIISQISVRGVRDTVPGTLLHFILFNASKKLHNPFWMEDNIRNFFEKLKPLLSCKLT